MNVDQHPSKLIESMYKMGDSRHNDAVLITFQVDTCTFICEESTVDNIHNKRKRRCDNLVEFKTKIVNRCDNNHVEMKSFKVLNGYSDVFDYLTVLIDLCHTHIYLI